MQRGGMLMIRLGRSPAVTASRWSQIASMCQLPMNSRPGSTIFQASGTKSRRLSSAIDASTSSSEKSSLCFFKQRGKFAAFLDGKLFQILSLAEQRGAILAGELG